MLITVTEHISLNSSELKYTFIVSSGPGGQNVNKVATAVQLRFNVLQSDSLSESVRARLIAKLGKRVTGQGDLIIKADRYRTQERNRQDALERLCQLIREVAVPPKKRQKTRPTLGSKKRRLDTKKRVGEKKALRRLV